jgi:uncharacterized protein DUF5996
MNPSWPPLPYDEWKDTLKTLHRYSQVVGKLALGSTPPVNHFWSCALRLSARGLRTKPLGYNGRLFDIEFDLVDHRLRVRTADGEERHLSLDGRPVALFYRHVGVLLASLGIDMHIRPQPCELVEEAIPLDEDFRHATYDRSAVDRYFRILRRTAGVLASFRSRFVGKASPVLFWWGSFDIASTRFSGRRATPPPEADAITREAYSHECWSAGFWPGDARLPQPAFYAYAQPAPLGFAEAPIAPRAATWSRTLGEYILPYADVAAARRPADDLLAFLDSTYDAAAALGHWDREALERAPQPGDSHGAALHSPHVP